MAGGQVDGIYSGLNTTSIIDAIMKVEHRPVDLYQERQTEYTNQLTAWQALNSYLLGFKTQSDVLAQSNIWNSTKVTSSDDTLITATGSGSPAQGTYFVSVDQLAQNQQIASQGFSESSAIVGIGTIDIKVGANSSKTITLQAGSNSLEGLKNAINNANAGVTAAIINDGSPVNPYRLILSSTTSGAANQITFTSNLTGGNAPNFTSKYFDVAEKLSWTANATSGPYLGTGATYTGSKNKTYTFTVQGAGNQTIGNGPISLGWSDGTNSGTIVVNSAGEQVALSGDGADGLSVSFSSGDLVAGDTFQIQAMSPLIQAGQDAVMRLGADGSGGSPIVVTSATNEVKSLIDGVTLDLIKVTTEPVQIKVESDYSSISDTVNQFVEKYNTFADFIDKQSSFNSSTGSAGVLLGESSVLTLMSDIRASVGQKVKGVTGSLQKLSDVGIKFNTSGRLSVDTSILMDKLSESPDEVRKLFLASGSSNNGYISYIASGAKTVPDTSGYNVDITQAALQGKFEAGAITNPSVTNLILNSTNNNIILKINGITSNSITLAPGTYTSGDDLAHEIETKINADQSLSSNDVAVKWIDEGGSGHLEITSVLWGSNSKVEMDAEPSSSAHAILGFGTGISTTGKDVAGTINGEAATGVGQILTGKDTNSKTAGLKLKITLTPEMLVDGSEGKITLTKGYAATISGKLNNYTDPTTGILSSRSKSLQKQIDNLKEQITSMEEILAQRRQNLYDEYAAMEEAIGKLQSQQSMMSMFSSLGSSSSSSSSLSGNNS